MGLATYPTEELILVRLRTIPFVTIYDDEVPYDDDIQPPIDASTGLVKPYCNIYFGGPREAAGDRGIVEASKNGTVAYVTVQVNGGTGESVRRVKDQVSGVLVGWVPDTNSSQLRLEGSVSYRKASTTTMPKLFVYEVAYSYRSNMNLS